MCIYGNKHLLHLAEHQLISQGQGVEFLIASSDTKMLRPPWSGEAPLLSQSALVNRLEEK